MGLEEAGRGLYMVSKCQLIKRPTSGGQARAQEAAVVSVASEAYHDLVS